MEISNKSRVLYGLAVCFVALICGVVSAGIGTYNLVRLVSPQTTIDAHIYNAHQSNDAFRGSPFYGFGRPRLALGHPFIANNTGVPATAPLMELYSSDDGEQAVKPDNKELEQLRLNSYGALLANEKRNAVQTLIQVAITFIISLLVFAAHWRMTKQP
tara:strand:- start:16 stop:489 length:474 start_codon:yes stop_codon:yes gene_type:complete